MADYYYEDDAQAVDIIHKVLQGRAMRPPRSTTKYHLMSARISEEAHKSLQDIAKQLGYVRAGKGNVSLLLEAIGTGMVGITQNAIRPRRL